MEVARNPELFDIAHKKYVAQWRSVGDTSESYWATWLDLHSAFWTTPGRDYQPPVPITPEKLHIIGTLLKEGHYFTPKNYLHQARKHHVESGSDWTQQLDLAASRFVLPTQRGIGPGRQSHPLNYEIMCTIPLDEAPLIEGGPVGNESLVTLFTMFLISELEGALALRTSVHINNKDMTITWILYQYPKQTQQP